MQVINIGLDLARNVFDVHCVTEDGEVVFNRPMSRAQVLVFPVAAVAMANKIARIKWAIPQACGDV